MFDHLKYIDGNYKSPATEATLFAKAFPTLAFYKAIFPHVYRAAHESRMGIYNDEKWCRDSYGVFRGIEIVGGGYEIDGLDNLSTFDGPCVFVANHMSTLETFLFPALVLQFKTINYIIKKSLTEYPYLGALFSSCDPIVVSRNNPREDLKTVMSKGVESITKNGKSIVVFPQTTRADEFVPANFNTIGVKLAKRAGVPIVPVALKTNAWSNGKILKDFGTIHPERKVYLSFGKPMEISNRGTEEHEETIRFISEKLKLWSS